MSEARMAPQVLIPYDPREAISIVEAALFAGVSRDTMKRWADVKNIGRPVVGRWMVSRIALQMLLDSNRKALNAYLSGDRTSEIVQSYFRRAGLTSNTDAA